MIGTPQAPLENLVAVGAMGVPGAATEASGEGPEVVAAEDGREAAEAALGTERAAVWVGPTGSAAFAEFRAELARARRP